MSRILENFARQGLIQIRRGVIEILDLSLLKAYLLG